MQLDPLDPSLVVPELMDPGPIDPSVLTRQQYHRSNVIWNTVVDQPLLCCRRREAVIARAPRPHSQIVSYITRAGLYGLYALGFIQLDWALITALVERWRTETHTFHLLYGEMTITLEDVEVLLGLKVDGKALVGSTQEDWPEFCQRLLGVTPPRNELDGGRINMCWLSEQFQAPVIAQIDEQTVQQYARYHLLVLMGGSIFADKSISHVHLLWLQFLVDFDRVREYSWGSVALAWLYREMCRACKGSTSIGGALNLLQL